MKEFDVNQSFGNRKNILNSHGWNGGLYPDEWIGPSALKYWSKAGGINITKKEDSNSCLLHYSNDSSTKYLQSDTISLLDILMVDNLTNFWNAWQDADVELNLSFETMPVFFGEYDEDDTFSIKCSLINQVQHNGGVTFSVQLVSEIKTSSIQQGKWKLAGLASPVDVECKVSEWETHHFRAPKNYWFYFQVLDDDIEDIRFYVKMSAETSRYADIGANDGILLRNVKLWFSNTGKNLKDNPTYTNNKTYTVDDDFLLTPPAYEAKFGETPEPYTTGNYWSSENDEGYKLLHAYIFIDESGYPINLFRQKDGSSSP
jgi:hypothetical protein